MARAYNVACQQCGRVPDCGWVYICTQDKEFGGDPWKGIAQHNDIWELNDDDPPHIQLEKLGHSKSVVEQAKNGDYTPSQIELLKLQKQNLRDKIRELHPGNQCVDDKADKKPKFTLISGRAQAKPQDEEAGVQDVAYGGRPNEVHPNEDSANEDRARDDRLKAIMYPPCKSTFCHHCKAHFRARATALIDDAIDLAEPLQLSDFANTPISNANTLRTIGMRPVPLQRSSTMQTLETSSSSDSSNSSDTWVTTATAREQVERQADLTGAFYRVEPSSDDDLLEADWGSIRDNTPGIRANVKMAVKELLKPARKPSAEGDFLVWPEKGIFGPKGAPQTGVHGSRSAARNGIHGLQDAMLKGIHVPRNATPNGIHVPQDAAQDGDLGLMRAQSSHMDDDMDAESDGGISLTEEAAETHIPDIIAQA
ncbi:uncharacterized protein K452DRAFT_320949 [Aplosporella prunicola CBS 121167]|uniref:Uncharacterized protein n=1 Tax=Aplosporella prunicola CBS 121167 TaxID=1176127 RepID=A0A6A6B4R9_9PEZI|nr:uncharacterized protein K452DRAFT_320949 [Aplosporella prunicola CBS 121167]KAF2138846.1 hypothetical protein K452DRAFT_320949 [Aplosporella prunicola CBS 121167]